MVVLGWAVPYFSIAKAVMNIKLPYYATEPVKKQWSIINSDRVSLANPPSTVVEFQFYYCSKIDELKKLTL